LLWRAAEIGHEANVKLLLELGKADGAVRHEAVVKLLEEAQQPLS
jgi:hypothetical protein